MAEARRVGRTVRNSVSGENEDKGGVSRVKSGSGEACADEDEKGRVRVGVNWREGEWCLDAEKPRDGVSQGQGVRVAQAPYTPMAGLGRPEDVDMIWTLAERPCALTGLRDAGGG